MNIQIGFYTQIPIYERMNNPRYQTKERKRVIEKIKKLGFKGTVWIGGGGCSIVGGGFLNGKYDISFYTNIKGSKEHVDNQIKILKKAFPKKVYTFED